MYFDPRSPRYAAFLISGCVRPNCASSGAFWRLLGAFLGHIVDLGIFDMGKSRRTWRALTVSLRFAV